MLHEKAEKLSKDFENRQDAKTQAITGHRRVFCGWTSSKDCARNSRLHATSGLNTPISYRHEWYRKLIHLSSLWVPVMVLCLPRFNSGVITAATLLLVLLIELGYHWRWPVIHPLYHFFFHRLLRRREPGTRVQFSGGPQVLSAALACIILFPNPVYVFCALSVMIAGDAAAALVGRRWGRHRFRNGKSVEGTAAFLLTGILIMAGTGMAARFTAGQFLWSLAAVPAAALVELYSRELRLNDNISIPLLIGAMLTWLA